VLFAGRPAPEKGFAVLEQAAEPGTLVVATDRTPEQLRNLYAGSDVLVVPSLPTRDFLEPWGLVVNEAFHQGIPVIATDAVGAAAGGLVQHERTGLIVPAGNAGALREAIARMHDDELRHTLGANARTAVAAYTQTAWADAMVHAIEAAEGC
jgi:glycosyltransferase involved in cell wall biosynthesis